MKRERERETADVCSRYEEVANFYCRVGRRWKRVTQKIRDDLKYYLRIRVEP